MKVLHVVNNLQPAGAEILLSVVAPAIKKRGIDIEVVTLYKYPEKSLRDTLARSGVVVHSLDISFRYDFRVLWPLKKLMDRGGYDIVHAHLFPAMYWTALAKPRCKKLVLTEHGTFSNRTGNALIKPLERFMYGRYDAIVCVSGNVLAALSGWFPGLRSKMFIIYNGIQLERYRKARPVDKSRLGIPDTAPVCGMVARFYKPKDHKTIVDAVLLVPGLHVIFAGEGELEQDVRDYARAKGMDGRIHFLGYRSDIPSLLKTCDVYVHSSYSEGFGLSVVEAMACGIPVIASDVDGLSEIVQDKKSGLLFKCADAKDLADKIRSVLQDTGMQTKLKEGGLARVLDFSLDTTVDKLVALYAF
jgi:glycosyltransferase involved in cell wall biosynthesis